MRQGAPLFSSLSDQWRTPDSLWSALDAEFAFTDDPCPGSDLDRLELVADGLLRDWGPSTFCNPPFSAIADWCRKAALEGRRGRTVVLLIPARTDTAYWHDYVMTADEIRFLRGRLRFSDSGRDATFPSAVAIWRGEEPP